MTSNKTNKSARANCQCPVCGGGYGRPVIKPRKGGILRLRGERVRVGTKTIARSRIAPGYYMKPRIEQAMGYNYETGNRDLPLFNDKTGEPITYTIRDKVEFPGDRHGVTITHDEPIYARPSIRVYWPLVGYIRYPRGNTKQTAGSKRVKRTPGSREYGMCPHCCAESIAKSEEDQRRALSIGGHWTHPDDHAEYPVWVPDGPPARLATTKPTRQEQAAHHRAKALKHKERQARR